MRYQFLIDTYETEILKVLSVWAMFEDGELGFRPNPPEGPNGPNGPNEEAPKGRSVLEHMVHQSVSENLWFRDMLGIAVTENPLPPVEARRGFLEAYADNARKRLAALRDKPESWWEEVVPFFEAARSRAWIVTRRIAHTAHHRGQQTVLLRLLGRDLHSTYGPTADTGGLMQNQADVVYPYPDVETLLSEEAALRRKRPLPGPGDRPVTERPDR